MRRKEISTFFEFQEEFSTEEACARYFYKLRWPEGFNCPKCGHGDAYELPRRKLQQCKGCGYQVSLTAGTIMHGTHLGFRHWFWAFYLMSTSKHGISALELQHQLAIGSYRTSWLLCQKVRKAMEGIGEDVLKGIVEVDDAYIGAPEPGLRGRKTRKKATIVIAVESKGTHAGKAGIDVVRDASSESLTTFVAGHVRTGSFVKTDQWKGYSSLDVEGYKHVPPEAPTCENSYKSLPWSHLLISNLKAWLIGTFHGVRRQYLQNYLNEFVFRFNRRFSNRTVFTSLLFAGINAKTVTYKMLCLAE